MLAATLGLLVDDAVLQQLDISGPAMGDEVAQQRAETFTQLVLRTASKRTWSMSVYDLPGKAFAGLLDPVVQNAARSLAQCQRDCEVVQKAQQLQDDPACSDVEACAGKEGEIVA